MKTAEEKARDWIKDNRFVLPDVDLMAIDTKIFADALILFAKHQDRDTRRACAEAVILSSGHAYNACMNAKAL